MTPAFLGALRESLAAEQSQGLIFINRRGYAPALVCRGCGAAVECGKCAANMTAHKRGAQLRCHLCGASRRPPAQCAICGGEAFSPAGHGTQRVEEALAQAFPTIGAARLDRDSLSRRGAFAAMRDEIASGARRILVGTQIIAKGHDFPRFEFYRDFKRGCGAAFVGFSRAGADVCAVDADAGAGDAQSPRLPGGDSNGASGPPVLRGIAAGGRGGVLGADFWRSGKRRVYRRFRIWRFCGRNRGMRGSWGLFWRGRKSWAPSRPGVSAYDPVPDLASRVAGWHRAHILAQSHNRESLRRFLGEWVLQVEKGGKPTGIRWTIEVDPAGI